MILSIHCKTISKGTTMGKHYCSQCGIEVNANSSFLGYIKGYRCIPCGKNFCQKCVKSKKVLIHVKSTCPLCGREVRDIFDI